MAPNSSLTLMTIRPLEPGDLPAIDALQRAVPEAAPWPVADYLAVSTLVAFEGSLVGFLVYRALLGGISSELEILNLAVAPEARRRGIAAALLARLPSLPTFLEVRESNTAARSLYRKLGFREVGQRPGYYHHPPERAIVLLKEK